MNRYDYSLPKINSHRGRDLEIEKILEDLRSRQKLAKMELPSTYAASAKSKNIGVSKRPSRSNSNNSDAFGADSSDANSDSDEESQYRFSSNKRRDISLNKYCPPPDTRKLVYKRRRLVAASVGPVSDTPSFDFAKFDRDPVMRDCRPPLVTAMCWVVADGGTGEVIIGEREHLRREIASITKVMTCYVVCKLIRDFKIEPKATFIEVSRTAASMKGTSARLNFGDILSIWDLMHALMLPSGNDAAISLAESFGTYIYTKSDEYKLRLKKSPEHVNYREQHGIKHFLNLMNKTAGELNLMGTRYENPHGLMSTTNRSTAADIAILAAKAMKFDEFREIVNQKTYKCMIEQRDQTDKEVVWENTNKLLDEGWEGIKTGITPAAGPCFAGLTKIENQKYLVVVLGCETVDTRWTDCKTLLKWVHANKKLLIKS